MSSAATAAGLVVCGRCPLSVTTSPDPGISSLAREAFEENQVRIGPVPVYLGYQEVHQPGHPIHAQIRMAGITTEFAPRAPDPDNGRTDAAGGAFKSAGELGSRAWCASTWRAGAAASRRT
jgi:hypothetical protein